MQLNHSAKLKKDRQGLAKAEIEDLEKIYQSLKPTVTNTIRAKELLEELNALKLAGQGDPVIHFAQAGIDGKVVDTRHYQGKVYLIDFWGSWCIWCRKGHPYLKKVYQKYKDKGFEIIAVSVEHGSVDQQDAKWRQAVKEDELPWLHVLHNKLVNDLVAAFSINVYPTKLLIAPDGIILLRITDDQEGKLDQKLKELFQ